MNEPTDAATTTRREPATEGPTGALGVAPGPNEPVAQVHLDAEGRPSGATAVALIAAPPAAVWASLRDFEGAVTRIPMLSKIHIEEQRITVGLRFKISLFSARFQFTGELSIDEGQRLELRHLTGEPRNIHVVYELTPADEGRSTLLRASISFDILSLGWLVKFFLKHHPEIQLGVYAGTALVLVDAVRRGLEATAVTPAQPPEA